MTGWQTSLEKIRRASFDELKTRVTQAARQRGDAVLLRVGWEPSPAENDLQRNAKPAEFFFSAGQAADLAAVVRSRLPGDTELTIQAASAVCDGRFDLLGYTNLRFGKPIDWHFDPVHGKHSPLIPWHKLRFDTNEIGDPKIIWELNRHSHLVTLAKAYRYTGESRFAGELVKQWRAWHEQNPYGLGINWSSSLEVAFRSIAWLWCRALLSGAPIFTAELATSILRALAVNGRHISSYLSTYSSPNTHLLGEAVALFFIGTLCPELPQSAKWQREGLRIIMQEMEHQVRPDGMHFEQSTHYHVYALDFFLHTRLLCARNRIALPPAFDEKLHRMLDVLAAFGQNGPAPRFGDDDGGRLFDPRRNRAEHMLDPLPIGAVLFRRSDLKSLHPALTEESVWLLGAEGVKTFDDLSSGKPVCDSSAFAESGFYVMSSGAQQMVLDAGELGTGNGGHGHADALAITVNLAGSPVLIDPGTCTYADHAVRDKFRATAAHNTIHVDSQSQARPVGAFRWKNAPDVKVERWRAGKSFDLVAARHNGFARISPGMLHRRSILHLKSRFWLVHDELLGSGTHDVSVQWHFHPSVACRQIPFGTRTKVGETELALMIEAGGEWTTELIEDEFSAAYGIRERAPTFVVRGSCSLPRTVGTLLHVLSAQAHVGSLTSIPMQKVGVAAYQYTFGDEVHGFVYGNGQEWLLGDLVSDAVFLYYGYNLVQAELQLIICDGSAVRLGGRPLIEWDHPVQWYEWKRVQDRETSFASGATENILPSEAVRAIPRLFMPSDQQAMLAGSEGKR